MLQIIVSFTSFVIFFLLFLLLFSSTSGSRLPWWNAVSNVINGLSSLYRYIIYCSLVQYQHKHFYHLCGTLLQCVHKKKHEMSTTSFIAKNHWKAQKHWKGPTTESNQGLPGDVRLYSSITDESGYFSGFIFTQLETEKSHYLTFHSRWVILQYCYLHMNNYWRSSHFQAYHQLH